MSAESDHIDYVLVYSVDVIETSQNLKRLFYQHNITKKGVKITIVDGIKDPSLKYVLVQIPWELLIRYADDMRMKMPLKTQRMHKAQDSCKYLEKCSNIFRLPMHVIEAEEEPHLEVFRCDKIDMFNIKSKATFFSPAKRSLIAFEILNRTSWSKSTDDTGLDKLINSGVYWAAYPLHEGSSHQDISKLDGNYTDRQWLSNFWARPNKFYKKQPIKLIRHYFGEKIAVYFAWLGTFTLFLIPAALFGTLGFIYSVINFGKHDISQEVCYGAAKNIIMCPLCNEICGYWSLGESCLWTKISLLFDNTFAMVFSIFMCIWSAAFVNGWLQKERELQYDWNTYDFVEMENVRFNYEMRCRKKKMNFITGKLELYMPFKERFPRLTASGLSVLMMVCSVMAALLGVIAFRVSMVLILSNLEIDVLNSHAKLATSALAALLNLIIILILTLIYREVASWLTDFENPRTESQYDDSLTLKMYIFQFFNFYSSLFYIAFIKGSFIGRPGNYTLLFGKRQEECDPAGCLVELSLQMVIIFVGKQVANNIMEFFVPFVRSYFQNCWLGIKHRQRRTATEFVKSIQRLRLTFNQSNYSPLQWEKDFKLVDANQMDLFDEYLEMVIQYGFVTMFSVVMPLAPLLALINNIIEIRLDAHKMLVQWRRPKPSLVSSIGIWNEIIRLISLFSIVINAFIISYTSSAVPEMVYRFYYSDDFWNMKGYKNFSLSVFNISDFNDAKVSNLKFSTCRYRDFRIGPQFGGNYKFSIVFWHVLAARLAFVIVFEHVVFFLINIVNWLIPINSKWVKMRMKQEKYVQNVLIMEAGNENLTKVYNNLPSPNIIKAETTENQSNI